MRLRHGKSSSGSSTTGRRRRRSIVTELGALQITSVLSTFLLAFTFVWVGISLWMANGERFFLRLLAAKLIINLTVSSIITLQTLFETEMVSHEPITWVFQWTLRIAPGILAVIYLRFSEEIRPRRLGRAAKH